LKLAAKYDWVLAMVRKREEEAAAKLLMITFAYWSACYLLFIRPEEEQPCETHQTTATGRGQAISLIKGHDRSPEQQGSEYTCTWPESRVQNNKKDSVGLSSSDKLEE
jgi:hypothetical protein